MNYTTSLYGHLNWEFTDALFDAVDEAVEYVANVLAPPITNEKLTADIMAVPCSEETQHCLHDSCYRGPFRLVFTDTTGNGWTAMLHEVASNLFMWNIHEWSNGGGRGDGGGSVVDGSKVVIPSSYTEEPSGEGSEASDDQGFPCGRHRLNS